MTIRTVVATQKKRRVVPGKACTERKNEDGATESTQSKAKRVLVCAMKKTLINEWSRPDLVLMGRNHVALRSPKTS